MNSGLDAGYLAPEPTVVTRVTVWWGRTNSATPTNVGPAGFQDSSLLIHLLPSCSNGLNCTPPPPPPHPGTLLLLCGFPLGAVLALGHPHLRALPGGGWCCQTGFTGCLRGTVKKGNCEVVPLASRPQAISLPIYPQTSFLLSQDSSPCPSCLRMERLSPISFSPHL